MCQFNATMLLFLLTSALAPAAIGQSLSIHNETCSPSEEGQLCTAIGKATQCLDTVLQIHQGTLSCNYSVELRQRYFGDISDADLLNVTDVFSHVQDKWSEKEFTCAKPDNEAGDGCTKIPGMVASTNVIVSKSTNLIHIQADEIRLCTLFSSENNMRYYTSGSSPESTSLIHEMTHATANPRRTQDIKMPDDGDVAYGNFHAQQLAFWAWQLATRNAENSAFYTEAICGAVESGVLPAAKEIDRTAPDATLAAKIEDAVFETSPEEVLVRWSDRVDWSEEGTF